MPGRPNEGKCPVSHETNGVANGSSNGTFVPPDVPSKCTYRLGDPTPSPHRTSTLPTQPKILPNVLSYVGNTPLIKTNKIAQSYGLKCDVLVKCEFFSASGSVKDRIALRMIEDAEEAGLIKPGDTLIEPTSGNTGIALALVAAVKGYRMVIVMPHGMSQEKVDVLRGLGAEIIRTPKGLKCDSPDAQYATAHRLSKQIPNSIVLNQYSNPGNPLAHYDTTAEEILDACDGKLEMMVIGVGTGGSLTGVARKLKEKCPSCTIVGADPYASTVALPPSINKTHVKGWIVEGIGHDYVPTVCDRDAVDIWYKCHCKDTFLMSRRLIKDEGLFVGGSCGAAMWCAIQAAKDAGLKEGDKVVVLLPDSVRNYMTRFLTDEWMIERDFIECKAPSGEWWWDNKVNTLDLKSPDTINTSASIQDALDMMNMEKLDQVPVLNEKGDIEGVVTVTQLMTDIQNGLVTVTDPVSAALYKLYKQVNPDTILGKVSVLLRTEPFVVVLGGKDAEKKVLGIITRLDLLNQITSKPSSKATGLPTIPTKPVPTSSDTSAATAKA